MERSAVVYAINDRLIIGASRRTATGLRLEVEPQTLGGNAGLAELVASLSSALAASMPAAIPPRDWKGFFDPFLKAAGVRSFKAFMAAAQSVSIDERDGTFVVTPYRNLGPSEGFEPIPSEAATSPDLETAVSAVVEKLRS